MRTHRSRKLLAVLLALAVSASLLTLPAAAAGGKIDVWDFGAEQLDASKYENHLTEAEINSWFAGVAPGTASKNVASFTTSDGLMSFSDGGKPNAHRLRTTNNALTHWDNKSLSGADGTTYTGYIYSNSSSTKDVYLAVTFNAGDTVTVVVGSNGGDSTINFEGPSGLEATQKFISGGAKAQSLTFYPKESGVYKFYSTDEKLVIARIYREGAQGVTVSGKVTQLPGLNGHSVLFTNRQNGAETVAPVTGDSYSVSLNAGYTYDVSLKDANGYVITGDHALTLAQDAGAVTFDVTIQAVSQVTVTGKLVGLSKEALASLKLIFGADTVYVPQVTITGDSYTAVLAKGDTYVLTAAGVNDYDLTTQPTVSYDKDAKADITFTAKPTHKVTIAPEGAKLADLKDATFIFTNLDEAGEKGDTRLVPYSPDNVYPYTYTFTGPDKIALRAGTYNVSVEAVGFAQELTSNLVVKDAAVTKTIQLTPISYPATVPFKATLTVGKSGCDYTTVTEAVKAAAHMERPNGERVTISIQPGNYEEMPVVDVPNITFQNASATPSTALTNKGVDIDPNAVRISWYYGHGYNYYSMNDHCKYDPELLAVNKANGYESFTNPGAGSYNDSYWNSSVIINADGFEAKGIIFENSFNQYISPKSLEDVIVPNGGQKEGATPRAELKTAGDTTVQQKPYVERAGALAIKDNCKNIYFENCKFIGRQDTLYGGKGVTAAFYGCQIVGSTDYIYGPMTAVFAKCDLVFNTSENNNDKGYVTAPQQTSGRGFLLYNCNITSTTPGVDTASELVSKPGYFGRPWTANTGEAVFYETVIGTASDGTSLIHPDGWLSTLSGQSAMCGEYNTHELTPGVDNSAKRVSWVGNFSSGKLADGSPITVETFLGSWDPFAGKDMTISTSGAAAPAAPAGTGFADVPADMYCAEPVKWAVENNVTTGTGPNTFSPGQTCTVKEILTLMWRAKGSPATQTPSPFATESWYEGALGWAAEKGLIGAETTDDDQPCTRAMVCTYLWRLAGSPTATAAGFADVPADAAFAPAVSWAVNSHITNGTGAGFSPDRTCSRGEIITFLYRSLV